MGLLYLLSGTGYYQEYCPRLGSTRSNPCAFLSLSSFFTRFSLLTMKTSAYDGGRSKLLIKILSYNVPIHTIGCSILTLGMPFKGQVFSVDDAIYSYSLHSRSTCSYMDIQNQTVYCMELLLDVWFALDSAWDIPSPSSKTIHQGLHAS